MRTGLVNKRARSGVRSASARKSHPRMMTGATLASCRSQSLFRQSPKRCFSLGSALTTAPRTGR
jgi:hypothetical protein